MGPPLENLNFGHIFCVYEHETHLGITTWAHIYELLHMGPPLEITTWDLTFQELEHGAHSFRN